jgi:hypothetical protein
MLVKGERSALVCGGFCGQCETVTETEPLSFMAALQVLPIVQKYGRSKNLTPLG